MCAVTFGWRHVEGHALRPGTVACQRRHAHFSRVVPRTQVAEPSSSELAVVLAGNALVFLRLKKRGEITDDLKVLKLQHETKA